MHEHATDLYPGIAQTLAKIQGGSNKLSDRADADYFFDFHSLYSLYDLDRAPADLPSAISAAILLQPTVSHIYNFLPLLEDFKAPLPGLELTSRSGPFLSHKAREMLTAMTKENDASTYEVPTAKPGIRYTYFENHGRVFHCCAYRLLRLLGVEASYDLTGENVSDNAKLGMLPSRFFRFLSLVDPNTYTLFRSYGVDDHHSFALMTLRRLREQPNYRTGICIFLTNDHVSFAIRDDVQTAPLSQTDSWPLPRGYVQVLEDKYPKNRGRAGGKILLDWHALPTYIDKPGVRTIVKHLIHANNNWEMVAALCLTLLPLVTATGKDLAIFLDSTSTSSRRRALGQGVFNLDFLTYTKTMKALHTQGRMASRLMGYRYLHHPQSTGRVWGDAIYGLDTLAGRSEDYPANFADEVVMRVVDPTIRGIPLLNREGLGLTFDTKLYERLLQDAVDKAVDSVMRRDVTLQDFSSWYGARMFWGASGGAPGATVTYEDGTKMRLNKRGALLNIPEKTLRTLWDRAEDAVQWSLGTVKYESGKIRYILTTSVYHYVSQAYVLDNFDRNLRDDTWYSSAHHSTARIANQLRRISQLQGGHALMWDYSDYNLNHIFVAMVKLYKKVVSALIARGKVKTNARIYEEACADLEACLKYIENARYNTYLSDNDTGLIAKIIRGLQSGERGTSFINSLCNMVDSNIADETARILFGRRLIPHQGDRQGDDVFLNVLTAKDATLLCCLFNLTGAAGQLYKITSEYCTPDDPGRGELLRSSYDGVTGRVVGYPLRALVGFVHGEYFSEPMPAVFDRAATILEQVAKLTRRGVAIPPSLVSHSIKRNAALTYTDPNTHRKHRIQADPLTVLTPAALGGIGVSVTKEAQALVTGGESLMYSSNPRPYAILIPSGEGKTTLSRLAPSIFVDHDALLVPSIHENNLAAARVSGDWSAVNAYLRETSAATPNNQILLSWSPDTIHHTIRVAGAVLLTRPTGLRANKSNRRTITTSLSQKRIVYAPDHRSQLSSALDLAGRLGWSLPGATTLRGRGSPNPLPIFSIPLPQARNMLKIAKTNLVDFGSLYKLGVKRTDAMDEAIVTSGLSGAYHKFSLQSAISLYGKELLQWTKSLKDVSTNISVPDVDIERLARVGFAKFVSHVGLRLNSQSCWKPQYSLVLNSEGYPKTKRLTHFYSSFERLIKPSGLSLGAVLREAVDQMVPTAGQSVPYSKLVAFITLVRDRKAGGQLPISQRDELNILDSMLTFLKSRAHYGDLKRQKRLYEYIYGSWDLLPPRNYYGWGADLISTIRDVALSTLEDDINGFSLFEIGRAHV